jgi:ribosomal-protein-alanine N-acetyltransferase
LNSAIPPPAVPLDDGVVTVREWSEADVPALVTAAQDRELSRFTRFPSPYRERDARDFMAGRLAEEARLAIVAAQDARLLGGIGLRDAGEGRAQVGYWVAAAERGRGVATRALRLVCRWALDELGVKRLQLLTDPANLSSQRVAVRVGFRREGILRSYLDLGDRRRDGVMFSLLPGELAPDRE